MMLKKILIIVLMGGCSLVNAQENLVPNFDFSNLTGKVKDKGAIASAGPWNSPTLAQADLYVVKTKNYSIAIPKNAYGEEKPMEGANYAGIIAYSYKGKVPRSYLQVKLTKKMVAGKQYCVKMHVSLADLSKYACNNIGIALSNKELTANNSEVLQFDAQIVSRKHTIYETQFYWTPICGIYTAKGGEEYLTLGNFTPDDKLQLKKVKRPRGFSKPQTYDAYYYIDNVSVTPAEQAKKCDCDAVPGMENAETVSKSFNSEGDPVVESVKIINTDGTSGTVNQKSEKGAVVKKGIDGLLLPFEDKKNTTSVEVNKTLDMVVAYLKEHETTTITITGYIDKSESDVAKLSGKRVGAVYKYMVSKGIAKERLDRSIGGADSPVDPKDAAKNRRVEITILDE